jgi:uncharacterized protein (TIGR03437 family)
VDARGAGFCGSRLNFDGGNPAAQAYPESTITYINEYLGSDPSRWRTHVPAVTRVRYRNVYPGIDVVYYSRHGQLEYDFVISPGSDAQRIRLSLEQVDGVAIDAHGNATVGTAHATAALAPPVVYQEREGQRRTVRAHYVRRGPRALGIEVERYDHSRPLVVDPVLYATYLGGSGADSFNDMKLDPAGNIVIDGTTDSFNFPKAAGAAHSADALVVKLNPSGTAILFATYVGGSGTDSGTKLALDSTGAAYVLGSSGSTDFPYTSGAYRANSSDASGTFIAKLSATGALVYSAQVAASATDSVNAIVADGSGRAIYGGATGNTALPVTAGAFQTVYGGDSSDGFIGALTPDGAGLSFLTYLGGNFADAVSALALDSSGSIIAAGQSTYVGGFSPPYIPCSQAQNTFPITAGAYRSTYSCNVAGENNAVTTRWADSFVAKVNRAGTTLIFSTFAPQAGTFGITSLAVDRGDNIYLGGAAYSIFVGNRQNSWERDFVAKLNPPGSSLLYWTSFGQVSAYDFGLPRPLGVTSLALDRAGGLLAAGSTWDSVFPADYLLPISTTALPYWIHFDTQGRPDFFSMPPVQSIGGIAMDASNAVILAGTATAGQLTSTTGALQANAAGGASDGFIERVTIDTSGCNPTASLSSQSFPSSVNGGSVSGSIVIGNGPGCMTQVTTFAPWLHIFAATAIVLPGSLTFYLDPNTDPAPRSATIMVGAVSLTLTQAGFSCFSSIDTTGITALPGGGSGGIQVSSPSGCTWNATSNAGWLSITSGSPGSGNGMVIYAVAANATGAQRVGAITIGGQAVTVTQPAILPGQVPSVVSLTPFQGTGNQATLTLVYSHPMGSSFIRAAEFILNPRWEPNARGGGCYVRYLPGFFILIGDDGNSIAGTASPGAATSISNSQCTLNAAASSATGNGNTLTLVASLTFKPSFTGQRHIWMQAVDYNNVTSNWLVYGVWFPTATTVNTGSWYRIFDPFFNTYLYSFDKNEYDTLGARGFVQQGISGLVMDSPTTVGGVSNIAFYRVFVNSTSSHFWTSDRNEFLTLINLQQAYVGEGVAAFVMPYINALGQVSPQVTNTIPFWRAAFQGANLHFWTSDPNEYNGTNGKQLPAGYKGEGIASYIFPASGALGVGTSAQFNSGMAAPLAEDGGPVVVAVVNGASNVSNGVIAPGQALWIYGRHLGGRVLLNGVPAQVIGSQDNEIRVVAPYDLATGTEATLEVEHRGRRSRRVTLSVVASDPAIFGTNQYGKGIAQARNEDGTTHGNERPAARGSVVTLYTTGVGSSGMPVEVHIGGQPAEVISTMVSGTRPGVTEVQVRVPETVDPAPFQPVVLHVGNLFSQPGVGLAIR